MHILTMLEFAVDFGCDLFCKRDVQPLYIWNPATSVLTLCRLIHFDRPTLIIAHVLGAMMHRKQSVSTSIVVSSRKAN